MRGTPQERFEAKVDRRPGYGPHGQCHLWTAYKNRQGYGRLRVAGVSVPAHRLAWELTNGPIPLGMCVLHKCDNPECVNAADCLFLGTQADNVADMEGKGRGRHPKGRAHGRAKLAEKDIPAIRTLIALGFSQRYIGSAYGVSQSTVSNIKRGKGWNHVTGRRSKPN